MFQVRIFTLYPDLFPGPLKEGLYGKALSNKIWDLKIINMRDYSFDKHKTVDDTPFGGGSGMLIKPDIVAKSIDENILPGEKAYYLTPKGKTFDQKIAKKLSGEKVSGPKIVIKTGEETFLKRTSIGIKKYSNIFDYFILQEKTLAISCKNNIKKFIMPCKLLVFP